MAGSLGPGEARCKACLLALPCSLSGRHVPVSHRHCRPRVSDRSGPQEGLGQELCACRWGSPGSSLCGAPLQGGSQGGRAPAHRWPPGLLRSENTAKGRRQRLEARGTSAVAKGGSRATPGVVGVRQPRPGANSGRARTGARGRPRPGLHAHHHAAPSGSRVSRASREAPTGRDAPSARARCSRRPVRGEDTHSDPGARGQLVKRGQTGRRGSQELLTEALHGVLRPADQGPARPGPGTLRLTGRGQGPLPL